jgi:hypothetical protein
VDRAMRGIGPDFRDFGKANPRCKEKRTTEAQRTQRNTTQRRQNY